MTYRLKKWICVEKLSKEVSLKIDQDLLDEVKEITKNKFPLRKIEFYSEAVREALIEFIKKNQRYKNKESSNKEATSEV